MFPFFQKLTFELTADVRVYHVTSVLMEEFVLCQSALKIAMTQDSGVALVNRWSVVP